MKPKRGLLFLSIFPPLQDDLDLLGQGENLEGNGSRLQGPARPDWLFPRNSCGCL